MNANPLVIATTVALVMAPAGHATDESSLEAFPAAAEDRVRYVIQLPEKDQAKEKNLKVELQVGRKVMTDGVNVVRFGGEIRPRNLEGSGYTYYEVPEAGPMISTKIAPPPEAKQVERFISTEPLMIRYNSRLPIVIYVPENFQVRYRLWEAEATFETAEAR